MSAASEGVDLGLIVTLGGCPAVGLLAAPQVWGLDVVAAGGTPHMLETPEHLDALAAGSLHALVLGAGPPLRPSLLASAWSVLAPGGALVVLVPARAGRRVAAAVSAAGFVTVGTYAAEPAAAASTLLTPGAVRAHLSTLRPLDSRRDVLLRLLAPLLGAHPGRSRLAYPSRVVIARRAA